MSSLKATSIEIPELIRDPLHSLQADTQYLIARAAQEPDMKGMLADSILDRLSQIEAGLYSTLSVSHDLYEALEEAEEAIINTAVRSMLSSGMNEDDAQNYMRNTPLIRKIDVALARARGESE